MIIFTPSCVAHVVNADENEKVEMKKYTVQIKEIGEYQDLLGVG
jgi:hypothetical protein